MFGSGEITLVTFCDPVILANIVCAPRMSPMYCSRCANELHNADFCSKCGQQVGATSITAKPKAPVVRGGFIAALLVVLFTLAGGAYLANQSAHANDKTNIESVIRTDFEKRGFTVEQVSLIKESDRRFSGFVRFRKSSGLLSKVQLSKNCIATVDADSSQYIWGCK
jgi:hypothetical protein